MNALSSDAISPTSASTESRSSTRGRSASIIWSYGPEQGVEKLPRRRPVKLLVDLGGRLALSAGEKQESVGDGRYRDLQFVPVIGRNDVEPVLGLLRAPLDAVEQSFPRVQPEIFAIALLDRASTGDG